MMEARNKVSPDSNAAAEARRISASLAAAFAEAGRFLFTAGAIIGPDRVEGRSRWAYGDDRVVGLAVVAEIGGDLASSAVKLLEKGHRYAAMTLLRQMVEVEYLLWLFAHTEEAARDWLNANDEDLWKLFRPGELRKKSDGRFRVQEYQTHCALGGHPSPRARMILPNHSSAISIDWLWVDLAQHLDRSWPLLLEAADRLGMAEVTERMVRRTGELEDDTI